MTRQNIPNNASGIYQIQSKINGKIYIGSAVNFIARKKEHFHDLKNINHHSFKLQRHCNKYGENDLVFGIIEFCDKEKLIEREQYYIDILKPEFNIAKDAKSPMLGRNHTEETKSKISKHHLKYYQTEKGKETIKKSVNSQRAFYQTNEGVLLKQKISKITGGENSSMKILKNRIDRSKQLKKFYQTEKGKEAIKNHSIYMRNYYQTEEGKQSRRIFSENHPMKRIDIRKKVSEKLKAFYQTEKGKQRLIKLAEQITSPEIKLKRLQIIRTPESLKKRSDSAKIGWIKRKKVA